MVEFQTAFHVILISQCHVTFLLGRVKAFFNGSSISGAPQPDKFACLRPNCRCINCVIAEERIKQNLHALKILTHIQIIEPLKHIAPLCSMWDALSQGSFILILFRATKPKPSSFDGRSACFWCGKHTHCCVCETGRSPYPS